MVIVPTVIYSPSAMASPLSLFDDDLFDNDNRAKGEEYYYQRIKNSLEHIVSKTFNEERWEIDINNAKLPKDKRIFGWLYAFSPNISEFPIILPGRPDISENLITYYNRVFNVFSIFSVDKKIYFSNQSLWINFRILEETQKQERKRIILFEPKYTKNSKIEADINHNTNLTILSYLDYSQKRPPENLRLVPRPNVISTPYFELNHINYNN